MALFGEEDLAQHRKFFFDKYQEARPSDGDIPAYRDFNETALGSTKRFCTVARLVPNERFHWVFAGDDIKRRYGQKTSASVLQLVDPGVARQYYAVARSVVETPVAMTAAWYVQTMRNYSVLTAQTIFPLRGDGGSRDLIISTGLPIGDVHWTSGEPPMLGKRIDFEYVDLGFGTPGAMSEVVPQESQGNA